MNAGIKRENNGHLNGTFIMKLQAEDKKLAKIEIKGSDGTVYWSSDPKPPVHVSRGSAVSKNS